MIPIWAKWGIVLALAAALYGCGYRQGGLHGRAQLAEQRANAEKALAASARAEAQATNKARAAEQAKAEAIAGVAEAYERGKEDAQATADRVAADLRAGSLRLRREIGALYTERLSRDSETARELTAAAERGAKALGEAIGIGAECDARDKAWRDYADEVTR